MISVDEAKRLIAGSLPQPKKMKVPLAQACGFVLAEEIIAPFDLPRANNSAMDGFALRSEDVAQARPEHPVTLRVMATLQAGETRKVKVKSGECCRIMTGAVMPQGADAVIAQEDVQCKDDCLVMKQALQPGKHVRLQGEEIKKHERVLSPKTEISPGVVGILASMGVAKVEVFCKPRVAVVTTGQELVQPGKKTVGGQIFDSNSAMVCAALTDAGFQVVYRKTVGDRLQLLKQTVAKALQKADVLILTGGVSVGRYDLVKDVLLAKGVAEIFWKVSQKPGKPLFVGKRKNQMVFALPGNPASVFVCFYEYVLAALRMMMGAQHPNLERRSLFLSQSVKRDPEKTLFLKARVEREQSAVEVLGHQASHMLSSLKDTTGLILLAPGMAPAEKGEKVWVDMLPKETLV